MIEALLSFEATGTGQPPPVIARMVKEAGERAEPLFPALRTLDSIGGPARPEDKVAAWRNLSRGYRISYASSLTGAISSLSGNDVLARPETAGRLNRGVKVDILDENGMPLSNGSIGLIRAWTPTMASAVLLPGGAAFVDPKVMGEGWGIPGDIGYVDESGFLMLVDRAEDMIVRGGVSVAPQELENLIRAHPKVSDVAVAGFSDPVMGQEIAAFVVGHATLSIGELRAFLAANVPPEKRPRELRLVTSLPYSSHGKLLRRVLVDDLHRGSSPAL
jgi:long-chain acyl-CoA synthetase